MTKRQCVDVILDFPGAETRPASKILIVIQNKAFPVDIRDYKADASFARICADLPFLLKWKDPFEVQSRTRLFLGRGLVLHPFSEEPKTREGGERIALLKRLLGDEKDMLLALAEEKGVQGLREEEILAFCRMEPEGLTRAAKKLEEEGKARILAFSPLALLAQPSLDFLCRKIVEFLSKYHGKHPETRGVAQEKIARRFNAGDVVLQLALKHLAKIGEIQRLDGIVALSSFKVPLSSQEENILIELEQMCFDGKFSTVMLEDIRHRFQIPAGRLQTLVSLLVERKKIIQSKEGFYLHSLWLDEIIKRIRGSGNKDLSVADFKAITGLSRKFAIPLLELLDEMGITRRKGPGREIL